MEVTLGDTHTSPPPAPWFAASERCRLLEVTVIPGNGLDRNADPPSQGNFSIQEDK